jgi:bacillithiol biosynthesis deacetylase BshB1
MDPFDLVAMAPHPDDAELLCGGTLARAVDAGHRVAVVDLTRGELGSRGSAEIRAREATLASEALGIHHRENLALPDGALADVDEQRRVVVAAIRRLRPRTLILPYPTGRHPDHGASCTLIKSAAFLAGLRNYAPGPDPAHKPDKLLHASAFRDHEAHPTFVVDVTDTFERKMSAIDAFGSQFDGREEGGELFPTGRPFLESVRLRFAHYGSLIQVAYGEPFVTTEPVAMDDPVTLSVRSI